MKKFLPYIIIIAGYVLVSLPSCNILKPLFEAGQTQVFWDGRKLCLENDFSVQIDEAALLDIIKQGFFVGNDTASVDIKYSNGKLSIHPMACVVLNNVQQQPVSQPQPIKKKPNPKAGKP